MDKITYLHNFFYATTKSIFRLYMVDGGSIPGAGVLMNTMRALIEEAYSDVIKELANSQMQGGSKPPAPDENQEFPPGFSGN